MRALASRIERLAEQAARLAHREAIARVLTIPADTGGGGSNSSSRGVIGIPADTHTGFGDRPSAPSWARDLGGGRAAYVIGGGDALAEATYAALLAGEKVPERVALLTHTVTPTAFLLEALDGPAVEVVLKGARGTRKTQTGLDFSVLFAWRHSVLGGPLPVRVMIVGSTGVHLRATVLRSMAAPWWRDGWQVEDDGRRARFVLDGVCWVDADLVGVEDAQGVDRLRRECHLVMGDDPAPALGEVATGFSDAAWITAMTSCRLPTPLGRHPAVVAMNPSSRSHWTTKRFISAPPEGVRVFHVPAEEVLTPEEQAEQRRRVAGRPDLLARLVMGEASDALLGLPVAQGYDDARHVAPAPWLPRSGTLWLGWDAGLTPCCIVAQLLDGELRIYAALCSERAGTRDFIELVVQPWLVQHTPWAIRGSALQHVVDPAMIAASQEDSTKAPASTVRELLGGSVRRGPERWPARRDPLLALFNRAVAGRPALQISPVDDTELLRRALIGGWHYGTSVSGGLRPAEQPIKSHPDSDLGDALTYLIAEVMPTRDRDSRPLPRYAVSSTAANGAPRSTWDDRASSRASSW
jgi:hypothetical protein